MTGRTLTASLFSLSLVEEHEDSLEGKAGGGVDDEDTFSEWLLMCASMHFFELKVSLQMVHL